MDDIDYDVEHSQKFKSCVLGVTFEQALKAPYENADTQSDDGTTKSYIQMNGTKKVHMRPASPGRSRCGSFAMTAAS